MTIFTAWSRQHTRCACSGGWHILTLRAGPQGETRVCSPLTAVPGSDGATSIFPPTRGSILGSGFMSCHVSSVMSRCSECSDWGWVCGHDGGGLCPSKRSIRWICTEGSFRKNPPSFSLLCCPHHLIMAEYLRCLAPCPHQPCRHRPDHLWQLRRLSRRPRLRLVCPR